MYIEYINIYVYFHIEKGGPGVGQSVGLYSLLVEMCSADEAACVLETALKKKQSHA